VTGEFTLEKNQVQVIRFSLALSTLTTGANVSILFINTPFFIFHDSHFVQENTALQCDLRQNVWKALEIA